MESHREGANFSLRRLGSAKEGRMVSRYGPFARMESARFFQVDLAAETSFRRVLQGVELDSPLPDVSRIDDGMEDERWSFLLTVKVTTFAISLGLAAQIVCYWGAVRREWAHPIRSSFMFAPFLASMVLMLGEPYSSREVLDAGGEIPLPIFIFLAGSVLWLETQLYGRWLFNVGNSLKRANPTYQLGVMGNFLSAAMGSRVVGSDKMVEVCNQISLFFFSVGILYILLVFFAVQHNSAAAVTIHMHTTGGGDAHGGGENELKDSTGNSNVEEGGGEKKAVWAERNSNNTTEGLQTMMQLSHVTEGTNENYSSHSVVEGSGVRMVSDDKYSRSKEFSIAFGDGRRVTKLDIETGEGSGSFGSGGLQFHSSLVPNSRVVVHAEDLPRREDLRPMQTKVHHGMGGRGGRGDPSNMSGAGGMMRVDSNLPALVETSERNLMPVVGGGVTGNKLEVDSGKAVQKEGRGFGLNPGALTTSSVSVQQEAKRVMQGPGPENGSLAGPGVEALLEVGAHGPDSGPANDPGAAEPPVPDVATPLPIGKAMHPIYFLFVAPPSAAALGWSSILGEFDNLARGLYFISMFMYMFFALGNSGFFRNSEFSIAWWAYAFPSSAFATATLAYAGSQGSEAMAIVALCLAAASTMLVACVFFLTIGAIIEGKVFNRDMVVCVRLDK